MVERIQLEIIMPSPAQHAASASALRYFVVPLGRCLLRQACTHAGALAVVGSKAVIFNADACHLQARWIRGDAVDRASIKRIVRDLEPATDGITLE